MLGWRIRDVVSPTRYIDVRRSPSSGMQTNTMKYSIPLALLAGVRTLAEGVNAVLTVMPAPSASSAWARRRSGGRPIDHLKYKKGNVIRTTVLKWLSVPFYLHIKPISRRQSKGVEAGRGGSGEDIHTCLPLK